MKKAGFTLAEVLITLMILGIIAALTIPSLIQNTQKKEQIVQLKKGLSMINQAITMNYALEQEDLTTIKETGGSAGTAKAFVEMLQKRLAVTQTGTSNDAVKTQDGLTYYVNPVTGKGCSTYAAVDTKGKNACYEVIISTLPQALETAAAYTNANGLLATSDKNMMTGYYKFWAGADRVVPDEATAVILYAKDLSDKTGAGSGS